VQPEASLKVMATIDNFMYPGKVPLSQDGHLFSYVDGYVSNNNSIIWVDNFVLTSTLKIYDYGRGRSAVHFLVEDNTGRKYNMFLTDMFHAITHFKIEGSVIMHDRWTICKRGANYGIEAI